MSKLRAISYYFRHAGEYITTLLPHCYGSEQGPCGGHTFHIRWLPHWFACWFLDTFVISSCARVSVSKEEPE